MIVPEYQPGPWTAVVSDGLVALVEHGDPGALWESLRGGGGLAEQLGVLTRGGLADLPGFALLDLRGGSARVVLRGQVEVEVRAAGGTRVVAAPHVTTWSEDVVEAAEHVQVRLRGHDAGAQPSLPVLSAVVMASAVTVALGSGALATPDAAAPAAAPEPGPATEPEPAPGPAFVPEPLPVPEPERDADPASDYDHLFDHTVLRPVDAAAVRVVEEEAAVGPDESAVRTSAAQTVPLAGLPLLPGPPPAPAPAPTPAPAPAPADHDEFDDITVLAAQVPGLLAAAQAPAPEPASAPSASRWRLWLATGEVVDVDRTVLVGRAPQARRVSGADLPRLVTVASPQQDVSRTHVEVRAEGDELLVTDLGSTNGTLVLPEHAPAHRLAPGASAAVEDGTTIDLGDGVTFVVGERR